MKYTYPNPTPFRALLASAGISSITLLPLAIVLLIILVIMYPSPWAGFVAGIAVTFLAGILVVSTALWAAQTKAVAEGDNRFEWTYDLRKDQIILSALDKIKLSYEREGLKSVIIRRSAVVVQHARGSFMLPLPANQRQEILDQLRQLGWLNDRRRQNKRIRTLALSFLVGVIFAAAAAVIVYFLNYQ